MEINRFLKETKNYIMTYDYHTHTTYSHGKGSIEDNVKAAVAKGLKGIAITDHGPGHLTYGLKEEDLKLMKTETREMADKYGIEVLLGVEANIQNHLYGLDVLQFAHTENQINDSEFCIYDFLIAGYHYGVKNGYCISNWIENYLLGGAKHTISGMTNSSWGKKLRTRNTEMMLKAIYQNDITILTHPGDKGEFDIMEIAKACKDTDTLMEISTWHNHLTLDELKLLKNNENKFVISSDAHIPERVGDFEMGLARALEAGIEPERIVNIERNKGRK